MNKGKLEKLIKLVKELAEKEELSWFRDSLENHFSRSDKSYDFLRLQKKNFRIKGKKLYEFVSKEERNFKEQLIKDYIEMNIFSVLGNYHRTLQFCCMQVENILNYYCIKSKCFEKIKNNPKKYEYRKKNNGYKKNTLEKREDFIVTPIEYFFDRDKKERSIKNVSIWPKYAFWFAETQIETDVIKKAKDHQTLSNIVNARNSESHRNSLEFNNSVNRVVSNLKERQITDFYSYNNLLYKMASSLKQMQT